MRRRREAPISALERNTSSLLRSCESGQILRRRVESMRVDHPVPEIIEHFRQHKILIGPGVPGMDEYVRISLGQPDEMQRFWRVWDLLPHDPRHSH